MQYLFLFILAAVGIQRLLELRKSNKHVKALLKKGGVEHASGHYVFMVLVHFTWFISMLAEVFVLGRDFHWPLFTVGALLALVGNTLRFLSMKELGPYWNVRIVTIPGARLVNTGVYRYFRHPIYVGVVLEIAGIPLLHSAYFTAAIFTALNALVLRVRIREEERALYAK